MTYLLFQNHGYTDIHCHCLPDMDDGPASVEQAILLCRKLQLDGITTVIATPHQLGRYSDFNSASKIRQSVRQLNEHVRSHGIGLTILPGADVRVDERIPQLLEEDMVLTLADGGKYLLIELPHEIYIDIEPLLDKLARVGIELIISHPERHPFLSRNIAVLERWLGYRSHIQITAASITGAFGEKARASAVELLAAGLAELVATDSHDVNHRSPCMSAAFREITALSDIQTARLLCIENPLLLLKGQSLVNPRFSKCRDVQFENSRCDDKITETEYDHAAKPI